LRRRQSEVPRQRADGHAGGDTDADAGILVSRSRFAFELTDSLRLARRPEFLEVYGQDLRGRSLASGHRELRPAANREIAKVVSVSEGTIRRILRRHRETAALISDIARVRPR
jgi:hypothetical protein